MKSAVAFLQNMWLRNPEVAKSAIARLGDGHRLRLIQFALFRGCLTGRRIKAAFGDLVDSILWEETTREIADNPKTIFLADTAHIKAVLAARSAETPVITFGKIAWDAVSALWPGRIVRCPHPAARQPDTIARLAHAAKELREMLTPLAV